VLRARLRISRMKVPVPHLVGSRTKYEINVKMIIIIVLVIIIQLNSIHIK
jgi:hypothetical protein